ncbi:MAG: lysophospholipid acyltransferase family protein [Armatimonadetes bacterium]|nr:lysophospholipid acyltransferase family protein [Armatimonadota bacterium]
MTDKRDGLWKRIKAEMLFRLLWLIATGIAASVRYKIEGWEKLEKILADGKGGMVLTWHGTTVLPIYCCRNLGMYSIVSLSNDGDLQDRLLRSRGFRTIRGSSARHGIRALIEGIRRLRDGKVMALTPDGPRGPNKKVQPGIVHLARKSGCPVMPVGVACKPCKRLRSWDAHLIPMPFARAVVSFCEPLYILEADDESEAANRIENALNAAQQRAEETLG